MNTNILIEEPTEYTEGTEKKECYSADLIYYEAE